MAHTNHSVREELEQILSAIKNGETPKITQEALKEIGLDQDTLVVKSHRNNLPITHSLHRINGTWVGLETHSNQQGPQRVITIVNGVGRLEFEPVALDTNALREELDSNGTLTAEVDEVVDAVVQANQGTKHWMVDELLDGPSWFMITGSRLYVNSFNGYHFTEIPVELDAVDREQVRRALEATQPSRGYGLPTYDFPHTIHYVLEYDLHPDDVTVDDFLSESTN